MYSQGLFANENNSNSLKAIFSHHEQFFYMDMHHQTYEIQMIGILINMKNCLTININFFT
jgi:hypothetical protein